MAKKDNEESTKPSETSAATDAKANVPNLSDAESRAAQAETERDRHKEASEDRRGGPEFADVRRPRLGEPVIYVLGDKSPNKGEFRAGIISRILPEDPKFPGLANVTFYIAKNNDPSNGKAALPMYFAEGTVYDESGKPGTWHFRDDCGEADNGWE